MYISIDVETTGLDPETYQVLQLSAVAWTNTNVNRCPTFNMFVDPAKGSTTGKYNGVYDVGVYDGSIHGEAYSLQMNAWILRAIMSGEYKSVYDVSCAFKEWLCHLIDKNKVPNNYFTPMGINFGAFDWQFLKRMPGFPIKSFKHRALEVGSLYATTDGIPLSHDIFEGIAERHSIEGNAHEALYDAKCTLAAAMEKLA